jgi:LssY C-terminus
MTSRGIALRAARRIVVVHLPAMATMPTITRAPDGLPGDPLNVALIGSEADIQRAFAAAGWHPADPITLRSSLAIAGSVVLDRPDPEAPMSTLLLFGRHQDLSFEKDIGRSARERNHVERDTLMRDLEAAGRITTLYGVTGIGPTLMGRNGGGDRYFTDGELAVGVLAPEGEIGKRPPERLPNPTPVVIKNQFWASLHPVLALGGGGDR